MNTAVSCSSISYCSSVPGTWYVFVVSLKMPGEARNRWRTGNLPGTLENAQESSKKLLRKESGRIAIRALNGKTWSWLKTRRNGWGWKGWHTCQDGKNLKKNLKKLFKDQKIKIDPIFKYRRTKESEVFVDTTQIRAGKNGCGCSQYCWSTVLYGSIRTYLKYYCTW